MKKTSNLTKSLNLVTGVLLFSLASTQVQAARSLCPKISKKYQTKVTQKFNQNPFFLVESFLNLPLRQEIKNNTSAQNAMIKSSFDINRIYKSNVRHFKSKAVSKLLFDWIRTQYFNNLDKNLYSKNEQLFKQNEDLFNQVERQEMSANRSYATSISSYKCSQSESSLLGCSNAYIVTAQTAAAVSCKKKALKSAFESHFYLTYSKKYGFKIIDVSIAGKRLVLDSMKHMISLKQKGFNKNAIANHIAVLAQSPNTFVIPRKQNHTKKFLAKFKDQDPNRLPSSL